MSLPRVFVISAVLALSPTVALAQAESESGPVDVVVARVNGDEIMQSEVFELVQSLPPQYQQQLGQIYPMLVERMVDFKLAARAGRAAGLAEDAEVKERVEKARTDAIREVYLERQIDERITDSDLQQRYEAYVAENPPATEQRARHILLETEEEAKAVIEELNGGADFVELAKERSGGPSAPQGGDLGYFTAQQMVPEFAQAANQLEPGEYSQEPTKTQFGWHVIKLEDRRQAEPPSFEELEPQLRQAASREAFEGIVAELREGAEIEILPAGQGLNPEGAGEAEQGAQ